LAPAFLAADRLGIHAGDTVRLQLGGLDATYNPALDGPVQPFVVSGVLAIEGGFPPLSGGIPPPAILSSAYARAHPAAAQVLAFRLAHGRRDIDGFEREVDHLGRGSQVVETDEREQSALVQRSLAVQATALR